MDPIQLLQLAIEELADGLVVITSEGDIVMANRSARQLCYHLMSSSGHASKMSSLQLPTALWQQCQDLIQQGELQRSQRAVPEFELTLNDSLHLRVRVRWLETALVQKNQPAFLLLTLEELDRSVSKIQQYNLSDREQEVWKLRLQGYSYHEIASKLYITINTVKKHTKSIRAKQRLFEDTRILAGLA